MSGSGDAERRALAERLARLTEEAAGMKDLPSAPASTQDMSSDSVDGPGIVAIEQVIRAFAELRRTEPPGDDGTAFVWGHLQVLEQLGSGSYGEVYRAYDRVLERDVALKLRRGDEMSARAYILEARRLARVRHPNVLAVHGAAVHSGRAGLWCDLIDGRPLSDWVMEHGAADRNALLATACQLASALQAVHQAGLIHGDVKPGNIMRAGDGRVILMDFGTAVEGTVDGVHALYGSPLAMAPEQIDGSRISSAIDLYALGVVLYFLACGRYPLKADSLAELSAMHARGEQPDGMLLRTRCGRALAALIERLMSRDPAQRPDAAGASAELQHIMAAPQRRRRRWLVAGVLATLSTALLISLFSLQRVNSERRAAERAYQRETVVRGFMREFLNAPRPSIAGAEARVIDVLADALPVAEQRFVDDPAALAEVLGDIGISHTAVGAHRQAIPILRRAVELGNRHPLDAAVLLPIRLRLAASEAALEPTSEALDRLKALFAESRAELGEDSDITIQAALLLSARQVAQHDGDNTEDTLRFILERRKGREAIDDASIMASVQLIAYLGDLQRWDEADAAFRQALAVARERGVEGNSVGIALRSAGATLASQRGNYAEAQRQLETLLADVEKHFGNRHRNYRATLNHLAISQRMQGRHQLAIDSLRQALELASAQLPADHPEVLSLRENLASSLYDGGDRAAALALREEDLGIKLKALGARHQDSLISAINLAEQYVESDQLTRGLALAGSAAADAEAALGARHLFALEAREIAARAQLALGNAEAARDELQAVYDAKQETLGAGNIYALRSRVFLAAAHAAAGDRAVAMELLRPSLDALRAQFDADQPDVRRATTLMASLEAEEQ